MQARPDDRLSFAVTNSQELPALLRHLDRSIAVAVEENLAAISLVGSGITAGPEIAARLQSALAGVNVCMTAQGSSRLSMSFAVPEPAAPACVERLHREFFRSPDAARAASAESGAATSAVSLRLGEAAI